MIAFPEDPLILRPSLLLLATARRLTAWAAAAGRDTPRLARSIVVHPCEVKVNDTLVRSEIPRRIARLVRSFEQTLLLQLCW